MGTSDHFSVRIIWFVVRLSIFAVINVHVIVANFFSLLLKYISCSANGMVLICVSDYMQTAELLLYY